ncbi:MAG: winged helix-turn-helix domain-containing protein [Patescibacteria group bacterium]|nr:winged helix-turn-helix domain-containing protein [Patescibacteria group bacterium]
MKKLISTFKALGSDRRLAILQLLNSGQCPVGELSRKLGIANSTASYHLRKLYREGYIEAQRRKNETWYSVPKRIRQLRLFRQIVG